ncbi:MAG: hypothetical protein J5554_06130 [Paludibacteraceae bacterium]|nr:hypothetical protein [Paludibacteraceae bacterium]
MFGQLTFAVYIIYFVLLAIVFGIILFVLKKLLRKDVSMKKTGLLFIIIFALPFVLCKSCISCLEKRHEEIVREKSQESYVRKFLIENEAATLILPKFKVNSYDHELYDESWVIEFEEPIDSTQLQKIDTSGVAMVHGRVLFFPIVYGYSDKIDEVFLNDEYYEKVPEKPTDERELEGKYKYRNFRLELLPDGKTATLLYSYAHHEIRRRSGGSSHHHDD